MTELTREQKIENLIEAVYDGMDFEALFRFVHYYLYQEYKDCNDDNINELYNIYFPNE